MRRTSLSRRFDLDPAHGRAEELRAIWYELPCCVVTLRHDLIDPQHILGRGQDFGIKKDDPRREWFSSVFNIVPLARIVHEGPVRDHPLMRRLFLEIARKHVMNAVLAGRYVLQEKDERFLSEVAEPWLAQA
jgi:hypothetical protein